MEVSASAILLDIEGTTSSISFVHDEMFPYVRKHLGAFLDEHWDAQSLKDSLELLAVDAGHECAKEWLDSGDAAKRTVVDFVNQLMDGDVKATGLKDLQGKIWKDGFASGDLKAHVYDEVPLAIRRWVDAGIDVRIYSSGSVAAQKLFFGHTIAGDLLSLFKDHYDTTIGSKKESASYQHIAAQYSCSPREILFISDIVAELDAAKTAGLQTLLSLRPGSGLVTESHDHPAIESFDEIAVGQFS